MIFSPIVTHKRPLWGYRRSRKAKLTGYAKTESLRNFIMPWVSFHPFAP